MKKRVAGARINARYLTQDVSNACTPGTAMWRGTSRAKLARIEKNSGSRYSLDREIDERVYVQRLFESGITADFKEYFQSRKVNEGIAWKHGRARLYRRKICLHHAGNADPKKFVGIAEFPSAMKAWQQVAWFCASTQYFH